MKFLVIYYRRSKPFYPTGCKQSKLLSVFLMKSVLQAECRKAAFLAVHFFLIYINDICEAVAELNVSIKVFADDAKMYSLIDYGLSRYLNTACSRIESWAENGQMRLASNKCIAVRITYTWMHETTSNDRCLLGKAYVKACDIGVLIDNKLSCNQRISNIVQCS
jgi:hypothetical protein